VKLHPVSKNSSNCIHSFDDAGRSSGIAAPSSPCFRHRKTATLESMNGGCQFVKKDQQKCKRSVALGQRFCWQHRLPSKWRSLSTLKKRLIVWIGVLGSLASLYALLPHDKTSNVSIQTSGDHSPVVQDNQGRVEFNEPQSSQPKQKSKDTAKPNTAEGK
jgi:hypothetical protein